MTQVVAVRFPITYMKIMEGEAAELGVTRGQFLMMLVKCKRGEIALERTKPPPPYPITDKELRETRLYVWQVPPKDRQAIDEERLGMEIGRASCRERV